jgi:ankyrin repeat protein
MKKVKYLLIIVMLFCCGCVKKGTSTVGEKLFFAIEQNNFEAVKECLKDSELNLEDLGIGDTTIFSNKKDKRALVLAMDALSTKDGEDIPILLINAGAKIENHGDNTSYLKEAVANGNLKLTKTLIEHGADVNEKTDGTRAIDMLVQLMSPENENTSRKIMNYLIEKGAVVDASTMKHVLGNSWRYLYADDVLEIIKKTNQKSGISKLLEASIKGDNKYLQNNFTHSEKKKNEEEEILSFASSNCSLQTIQKLKKEGGNFKIQDLNLMTPVHIAALCNDLDVLKYFIEQKINGNPVEAEIISMGAVEYAALSGNRQKYEMCMNSKIKQVKGEGNNIWKIIGMFGTKKSLELIARYKKPSQNDIETMYSDDNEALKKDMIVLGYLPKNITYEMLSEKEIPLIEQLYNKGVFISQEAMNRLIELEENELVKKSFQKNFKKYDTTTLLYHAVDSGNLEMVKELVRYDKQSVNKYVEPDEEEKKMTPFQGAASSLSTNVLKYLMKHGGDLKSKDEEGQTPYEIAKSNELEENMKILKR